MERDTILKLLPEKVKEQKGYDVKVLGEYRGVKVDAIMSIKGQVVGVLVISMGNDIKGEAKRLSELSSSPVHLYLLVPRKYEKRVRDILWDMGLAAKVRVATFDVVFRI